MSLLDIPEESRKIQSGNFFKISGCYQYLAHVESGHDDGCIVPDQSHRMLFSKGEKAPLLGSCEHPIYWKLIYRK